MYTGGAPFLSLLNQTPPGGGRDKRYTGRDSKRYKRARIRALVASKLPQGESGTYRGCHRAPPDERATPVPGP